ncbi:MAG: hypothetical protein AAFN38_21775 [Cyanobacteria bacterium J06560_5]
MTNIIHDLHVAVWAFWACHKDRTNVLLTFTLPVSISRKAPPYNGAWIVRFQRPALHVLNTYEAELAYIKAHSRFG